MYYLQTLLVRQTQKKNFHDAPHTRIPRGRPHKEWHRRGEVHQRALSRQVLHMASLDITHANVGLLGLMTESICTDRPVFNFFYIPLSVVFLFGRILIVLWYSNILWYQL